MFEKTLQIKNAKLTRQQDKLNAYVDTHVEIVSYIQFTMQRNTVWCYTVHIHTGALFICCTSGSSHDATI